MAVIRFEKGEELYMAERPNIIWYCSDQQRFDTIHALGNGDINTPRLDAFMKEFVTFTHTFCQGLFARQAGRPF